MASNLTISDTGEQVVIEVFDTGIGLPEDRERLTEPYMTTRVRGTGLGLAIVKKIVEEHFGDIAFLDGPGAAPGSAWSSTPQPPAPPRDSGPMMRQR